MNQVLSVIEDEFVNPDPIPAATRAVAEGWTAETAGPNALKGPAAAARSALHALLAGATPTFHFAQPAEASRVTSASVFPSRPSVSFSGGGGYPGAGLSRGGSGGRHLDRGETPNEIHASSLVN